MKKDLGYSRLSVKGFLMLVGLLGSLIGCGSDKDRPKPATTSPELASQLMEKYETYLDLYKHEQDEHGFIESSECDSLLFSGLLASVLPEGVNIQAAQKDDGAWTRRPTVNGEDSCYPDHSKSSISRDMFTGLMQYIWRTKNLAMAEALYAYGENNGWVMGEGAPSRILFLPGNQADLAEMIYRLGGEDKYIVRSIPVVVTENVGFAAHLDVLGILLRGEMKGYIEDFDIIEYNYKRSRENALFAYVYHKYSDGVQDEAIKSLLNTQWFPVDRLPTKKDRKEPWLWQRDQGSDWEPTDGDKVHSGGDFLYVAHLILKDLGYVQ